MFKKLFKFDINLLREVFKEYKVTITLAIFSLIYMLIRWESLEETKILAPLLSSTLLIPLWAKVEEFKERNFKKVAYLVFIHIGLAAFFWNLNGELELLSSFIILLIAMSVLLLFIYKEEEDLKGASYSQKSLTYFSITTVYSSIVYLSLIFFNFLIGELFKVDFSHNLSEKLFFVVIYGISPITYLLLWKDNKNNFYHKLIILFQKYIAFPLLMIFLTIIYAYIIRIIAIREFPKRIVPYMLLSYFYISSLFYYLSSNLEINTFTKKFRRFNFYLYIPLLPLLYYSIVARINQYGFTENRYIILVNALYFTIITLYFLISKNKNLKVFPKLYIITALIVVIGPLNMTSITYYSQKARFKEFLAEVNGNWTKENNYKLSSFIDHFHERNQFAILYPEHEKLTSREEMAEAVGGEYLYDYLYPNDDIYFYGRYIHNISDYEYSFTIEQIETMKRYELEEGLEIEYEYYDNQLLHIYYNGTTSTIDLNQIAQELLEQYDGIEYDEYEKEVLDLSKEVEVNGLKVYISYNSLSYYSSSDSLYFYGGLVAIGRLE